MYAVIWQVFVQVEQSSRSMQIHSRMIPVNPLAGPIFIDTSDFLALTISNFSLDNESLFTGMKKFKTSLLRRMQSLKQKQQWAMSKYDWLFVWSACYGTYPWQIVDVF